MKDYVIIVAAGIGKRMRSDLPKQFLDLNGKPVMVHTIEKFYRFDPLLEIIVVLHNDYLSFWKELCDKINFQIPHRIVSGGEQRFHSVKNAIDSISTETGIVAIHDAVRPLVSLRTIEHCFATAREKSTAIPVIMVSDSMREMHDGKSVATDRNRFRIVQTPQCFELGILREAYASNYNSQFTDDASVVESTGEIIHLVEGNRENIKITSPEDLRMAEALLV